MKIDDKFLKKNVAIFQIFGTVASYNYANE